VYLKLDALQKSGSFKDRGMAHLCQTLMETTKDNDQLTPPILVSSSGGNAGLAVTTVGAQECGMTVEVIVPETTKPLVIDKLTNLGAQVTVFGANWNAADTLARQRVEELNHAAANIDTTTTPPTNNIQAYYVPPYDNPLLWEGHSSLVDELLEELPVPSTTAQEKGQPTMGAIIASIGGGGLLCGILEGLERYAEEDEDDKGPDNHHHHTDHTVVVCAETEGAASFGKAWNQPTTESQQQFSLSSIDSIATSLGALQVTPVALERAQHHQRKTSAEGKDTVLTSLCTDEEAIDACVQFASDHRMLVEPACGAALAVLYSERLRTPLLQSNNVLQQYPQAPLVVEVCGGSGVNVDLLSMWKEEYCTSSSSSSSSSK